MGAQKNRLIETVLLSTHNICLVENKKILFSLPSLMDVHVLVHKVMVLFAYDFVMEYLYLSRYRQAILFWHYHIRLSVCLF